MGWAGIFNDLLFPPSLRMEVVPRNRRVFISKLCGIFRDRTKSRGFSGNLTGRLVIVF